MSSDIAIKVKGVSKYFQVYNKPVDRLKQSLFRGKRQYYKEFKALDDVSFRIRKGETVGIVGQNGSGKSTLLQMICGTLTPTQGSIEVNGRVAALLELGAGFNPEFTGKENVYMNAAIQGVRTKEIDERYKDIVRFADIGDFIDQPVKTYSSGMYVRLAFSVAINVNPDILIIDEALSVGDEMFQRKCFSRIEMMRDNGVTVLFVSHSASAIIELCDRAILLDRGECLIDGAPKKVVSLYHKYAFSSENAKEEIRKEIQGEVYTNDVVSESDEIPEIERAYFDPSLVPESIVDYERQGVLITNPRITTTGGTPVNVLTHGERYCFAYDVVFEKDVSDISFGTLFKAVSGVELGGASFPSAQEGGMDIQAKDKRTVIFTFECILNAGVYFVNAGVTGCVAGTKTYLHRLVDAVAFRVRDEQGLYANGMVDFGFDIDVTEAVPKHCVDDS